MKDHATRAEAHELIDGLLLDKVKIAVAFLHSLSVEAGDSGGNFGQALGVRFTEWGHGQCACEAEVGEAHWNPHGIVHGGLPFALIDWAMGGAVTTADLQPGERPVTLDVHIRFHDAFRRGKLRATARVIQRSKRIVTLAAEVTGDDDRVLATATGSFYLLSGG